LNLCEYGCGQEAKQQFKNGKWCCEKNSNSCPAKRTIRSLKCKTRGLKPFQSRKHSAQSKKKISERLKGKIPWNKGKTYEELYGIDKAKVLKEQHSQFLKGHPSLTKKRGRGLFKHTEVNKKKQSERMKKNNPMKNPVIVDKNIETRKRNGTTGLGKPKPKYLCEQYSRRMKKNNPMKNPETVIKNFRSHNRKKSEPEKYLEKVINRLNLNIEFTGDGKLFINGKCPDFIIPNSKKVIEVYDSSFHYSGQIRDEKWIENRKKELYGYEVLFIDFSIYSKAKNFRNLCEIINNFYERSGI
jgi:very-short-patch-repair endonuclease